MNNRLEKYLNGDNGKTGASNQERTEAEQQRSDSMLVRVCGVFFNAALAGAVFYLAHCLNTNTSEIRNCRIAIQKGIDKAEKAVPVLTEILP